MGGLDVEGRCAAWCVISGIEQKEKNKGNDENAKFAHGCCMKVENELQTNCSTILELRNDGSVAKTDDDARIFYHAMMADSYRYTVEFEIDGAKKGAAENARKAYERASAAAEIGLAATQPSCLGLALNLIKQPLDKASGKWYAVAPEWSPVSRVREMQKRDKGHHRTTEKNTRRPPLPRVGGL